MPSIVSVIFLSEFSITFHDFPWSQQVFKLTFSVVDEHTDLLISHLNRISMGLSGVDQPHYQAHSWYHSENIYTMAQLI